jgi:uncharacterized protein
MKFEWNSDKSKANHRKHGIGFEEAITIWDSLHVRIDNIAKTTKGEKRHATIGELRNKLWIVFWTKRKNKIRIISVRRVRDEEERAYYIKIQEYK